MAEQLSTLVEDALETLVNQFAEPLSFFRELIQNSIDAGSEEIDITLTHADGLTTIEVRDYGQGMDRTIIDKRLTRLFSSSKDGDFTKIGRFGIGFVSVFAIGPEAVCVDTARGGERWRVLFDAERKFERIVLDEPVEGTRIRIYKRQSADEHDALVARAREVVAHWCRYAAAEIRFDGDVLNTPFELESPCTVTWREEGTRIVVGLADEETGTAGYYNRGLTLLEAESDIPWVSFRIDSRYLEHTLSRDNVLRDGNYDKAMDRLQALVEWDLAERVVSDLQTLEPEHADAHYGWLTEHLLIPYRRGNAVARRHLEGKGVFETLDGRRVSAVDVRRAHGDDKLYYEARSNPATELLSARGATVIVGRRSDPVHKALRALVREPRRVRRHLFTVVAARDSHEDEQWKVLSRAVENLLVDYGARVEGVRFGHLRYPHSPVATRVVVTQRQFGELTEVSEADAMSTSWLGGRRLVVLNADHGSMGDLLALARTEPELAAYLVVKILLLAGELSAEQDGRLAEISQEQRWRRLTA